MEGRFIMTEFNNMTTNTTMPACTGPVCAAPMPTMTQPMPTQAMPTPAYPAFAALDPANIARSYAAPGINNFTPPTS